MSASVKKKPFVTGLVESQLDCNVYQDVLKMHAKESISIAKFGNIGLTPVDKKTIARAEFTECEISPFRSIEYECSDDSAAVFKRQSSCNRFSYKAMTLSHIQQVLIQAYGADEQGRRNYPSAGGLYPVEPIVFLNCDKISDGDDLEPPLQSGFYHFRPVTQSLQLIKTLPSETFINKLLQGFIESEQGPCFAVLYLTHIGKAIFKYRYRGYRHAMMEAGSMYQQATFVAEQLNLRTTLWSSFSEPQIMQAIGLDSNTFMPLTMQLFGFKESA